MPPLFRCLPVLTLLLAAPVAAQPLLTPLAQDRHVSITLSGMSAGAQATYILESEAETFGRYYAGITGDLMVETALARGVVGHVSDILPNGFIIEQSAFAGADGLAPSDSAATLSDCTFSVLFAVQRHVRFEIRDLAGSIAGPGASSSLTLSDAAGLTLWTGHPSKASIAYPSTGVLAPGDYLLTGTSKVDLSTMGDNEVSGSASLVATFEVQLLQAACPCDWNFDGAVDSADLFAFLEDFLANHADFDGSGGTNTEDLFAFLACLLADCG